MLSSQHPSDPPCSSKSPVASAVGVADPATSLASTDTPSPARQESPDLVPPCPTFSIRHYAFDSRSKGIKRNWPFHPQSLELCLKHGVKDLLPPFEPPDFLRSRSFYTCTDSEEFAACSEVDAFVGFVKTREAVSSNVNTSGMNLQSCQLADESLGPSQYTLPEDGKTATDRGGNTNEPGHSNEVIQADQEDNICTKEIRQTEVARPSCRVKSLGSSHETSEKKGKLLVKSGSVKNIHQTRHVSSNSSSVLDPTASKTCPVCKVFLSTSNTTLNAHIDQCLYAVSNTELVAETAVVKPKVKQIKKQLMVDIYKTALPYTLEDLDRRNGTNWAIELSVPTANKDVRTKNRSPKVAPSEARDSERDQDVYVDSNGIKIRILSKSIDAPLVLKDELSLKKVAKHETGKSISMTKTFLESKSLGNKKFNVLGKKCNRPNHLKSQVGDIHDDTSEEEPAMHTRKPTESINCGGSEIIRRWMCSKSKRSDITKSFSTKLNNRASDSMKPGTKKLAKSCMLGFGHPQIAESYTEAFSSQSTEEIATTSEVSDEEHGNQKILHPCNSRLLGSIPKWSSENPPPIFPKVPRSAATLAKRKIKEIGRREASKSDKYDTVSRTSTMAKSTEACLSVSITGLSNEPKRTVSTSKVLRKHRSLLRTRKREFSPSLSGLVHGFGQEHELAHRHVNKKFSVTNNGTSKKVAKHTQEDTADNDVSCGTDVPALGQGDHQCDVEQHTASTHMDYEGEENATQVQYTSVCRNTHEDCCSAISSGSLSPENSKAANDILAKGKLSMEDPCSTEKSIHHNHALNIVANNEMEEWNIDQTSTKEPSACFTNNRDMGLATPQDNSSITSNREDSNQDHGLLAFDRGSSDSPISIASNMSSLIALKDSRIEESRLGPSAINVRTVEESMSGSSNQEKKSMPPARESEQLPNERLYCCSCRESISRQPHLDHESSTARSGTFTKKQVPPLHMGLRTSSSFSTYQRTDTNANPCLDAHEQSLTGKVSTESTMSFLSYTADCIRPSVQTQLPSPPSPMLRLMGKNLMVMNSQESGNFQAPGSDYMLRGGYMAPVSFVPPNYQHSDSAFIGRTPSTTSQQIPLPSVQAGSFVGPPMHGGFMVQPNHHSLQKPYTNLAPVMHHPPYMMKEVIMIYDDSPECRSEPQVGMLLPTGNYPTAVPVPNTSAPRPFYCHPSPVQILPRESFAGSMPVFSNISPMTGFSTFSQRNQVRYSQPLHAIPSRVQTPEGYLNPPVYYSQDFR
ncbi:unnamed protein product [Alopecurus aequalis]